MIPVSQSPIDVKVEAVASTLMTPGALGQGSLRLFQAATAPWPTIATETRANAHGRRFESSDGPQAKKQDRISALRPAQGNRGAGERPDQRSQGLAALLAT